MSEDIQGTTHTSTTQISVQSTVKNSFYFAIQGLFNSHAVILYTYHSELEDYIKQLYTEYEEKHWQEKLLILEFIICLIFIITIGN